MPAAARKPRKERLMFRVAKGALLPADAYTQARLRDKGLRIGDMVAVDLTKPRNPGFWRLAHRIGTLCSINIEAFHGMGAHEVLKKLQLDGNIECDEERHEIAGMVMISRKARSLDFASMDQTRFFEVAKAMCRVIVRDHWKDLDEDAVMQMAESMVDEA